MTAWVPCERCGSTGEVRDSRVTIALVPCPACSGLGELPSEGLIEAVTRAIIVENPILLTRGSGSAHGMARAALVAARLWEKENS